MKSNSQKQQLLIMFDCDGTLSDSHGRIVQTMQQAWQTHNHCPTPTEQNIRSIIGLKLEQAITKLAPQLNNKNVHNIAQSYIQIANSYPIENTPPLFPNIRQTIQDLSDDGHKLGIATGMGKKSLQSFLKAHQLQQYFITLKTADDGPSKPHPEILNQACMENSMTPQQTIVIGDSLYDIGLAKNANAHAIGVAWGYETPDNLLDMGALIVVHEAQQITDYIRKHF